MLPGQEQGQHTCRAGAAGPAGAEAPLRRGAGHDAAAAAGAAAGVLAHDRQAGLHAEPRLRSGRARCGLEQPYQAKVPDLRQQAAKTSSHHGTLQPQQQQLSGQQTCNINLAL